ncbi:sigma-54-dependent Fis family transcriptional regulator [Rhodococcus sp. NPDC059968]|uniref:sigma-54-dependent Fis family transcriptional regulator n=1 Tax=Rhodococcus sp. NPDC059968 TaxID=3347017 RepID=UPI00366F6C3C
MIDLKSVHAAREHLIYDGAIPESLLSAVRPHILQSWHRSIASGAQVALPRAEQAEFSTISRALRDAAEPVLSRLAERLSGLEVALILADRDAGIVRRWVPDKSIVPTLDGINSSVGFNVAEDLVGTNGIGTVIESGIGHLVSGPEHFSAALESFTCAGVPINHPITRRLEGVVTLSCPTSEGHALLTPLLSSTAQEIEHVMLDRASSRQRRLLNAYTIASKSRRGPVAAIGSDLFIAGPRVTELLGGIDQALLWEFVRSVALGSHSDGTEYGFSPDRFQIARCDPIESDAETIGAIVEFAVPHATEAVASAMSARPTVAIPGRSAVLAHAVTHATRLAAKGVSILIEGEPGVGKLGLASAILKSADVEEEHVSIIDAAIGDIEGTTHFVDALRAELGRRPQALLLPHLESLTPELAAFTASVLGEFTTVDWTPRVVATMTPAPHGDPPHQHLQRLIDTIAVGRVFIPPLRDRREDIAEAAATILNKHRGQREIVLSPAALRGLIRAPWPGNLRQLDTTIRGLLSTVQGPEIRPEDLPIGFQADARKRDLSQLETLELTAILDALRQHNGNKAATAAAIGMSRSTLYRKLHSYHVDPNRQYY